MTSTHNGRVSTNTGTQKTQKQSRLRSFQVPDVTYYELERMAKENNRSVNGELMHIVNNQLYNFRKMNPNLVGEDGHLEFTEKRKRVLQEEADGTYVKKPGGAKKKIDKQPVEELDGE